MAKEKKLKKQVWLQRDTCKERTQTISVTRTYLVDSNHNANLWYKKWNQKARYLGDILCQTIHQFDWPREFWDQNPRKKLENYLKWLNQFAPSMNVYPHAKNQHHISKVLLRVTTHFYFLSTPLLPSPPFLKYFQPLC